MLHVPTEDLMCIVCMNTLGLAKVFMCEKGHYICATCNDNPKITVCPGCRGPKAKAYERVLTASLGKRADKCDHPGCGAEMTRAEKLAHMAACVHRPGPCPLCGQTIAAAEVVKHVGMCRAVRNTYEVDEGGRIRIVIVVKESPYPTIMWNQIFVFTERGIPPHMCKVMLKPRSKMIQVLIVAFHVLERVNPGYRLRLALHVGEKLDDGAADADYAGDSLFEMQITPLDFRCSGAWEACAMFRANITDDMMSRLEKDEMSMSLVLCIDDRGQELPPA